MFSGGVFLSGLALGLSLILPIGPQNVFVLQQGLVGGIKRGLLAAATAGLCDSLLILTGAGGVSALLTGWPELQRGLLALGAIFLIYLGVKSWRAPIDAASVRSWRASIDTAGLYAVSSPLRPGQDTLPPGRGTRSDYNSPRSPLVTVFLTGVAVSWGNPHAILDTVAVLGTAIAAHEPASRPAFAAGTVAASWLFFLLLAVVGASLRQKLSPSRQLWLQRGSGAIMLTFAAYLAMKFLS